MTSLQRKQNKFMQDHSELVVTRGNGDQLVFTGFRLFSERHSFYRPNL